MKVIILIKQEMKIWAEGKSHPYEIYLSDFPVAK
jgi:hypothetical protein